MKAPQQPSGLPTTGPTLSKMQLLRNSMLRDHELQGELFHNLVASESARPRQPPMRMLRDQLLHDKGIREDKGFVSELNWHTLRESEAEGGAIAGSRIANPTTGAFSAAAQAPHTSLAATAGVAAAAAAAGAAMTATPPGNAPRDAATTKILARLADSLLHDPSALEDTGFTNELLGNVVKRMAAQKGASVMDQLQDGLMHDPDIQEDKGFMDEMHANVVARNKRLLQKTAGTAGSSASSSDTSKAAKAERALEVLIARHC